jgi:hypothetical protein
VYAESFRKFVDLEEDADRIRGIAVNIMPDVFQCESYIRAVFADEAESNTADWLDAAVAARLDRASILRTSAAGRPEPPIIHWVLDESAIRRVYGSRPIAREQIRHTIAISKLPNVTVQVVPFEHKTAKGAKAVLHPFTTLRIPVSGIASSLEYVYLSTPGDKRYLDDKAAVEAYDRLFTRAMTAALDERDSRTYMEEIAREYR